MCDWNLTNHSSKYQRDKNLGNTSPNHIKMVTDRQKAELGHIILFSTKVGQDPITSHEINWWQGIRKQSLFFPQIGQGPKISYYISLYSITFL